MFLIPATGMCADIGIQFFLLVLSAASIVKANRF
jgi:hypothetical protein